MANINNLNINIIFFILIYFIIHYFKIKKYYYKNLNNRQTLEEFNKLITIKLYSEYNEPCLTLLKEYERISYYKIFLSKYISTKINKIKKKPLISVIIPVYNGENILIRSLLSIESQTFQDFEIIYIDDCSKDNSIKLINELKLIDKRIRLFSNKKNRGTLYTKSIGVIQAKGNYILIIDQDDIYINNYLFYNIYQEAKIKDLDIVQFRHNNYFLSNNHFTYGGIGAIKDINNIITQPELGDVEFYLNETLYKTFFLWDKLIKKETYLKALKYLGEQQWGKNIVHREDHLMTFALFKVAKKFIKINLFGYSHLIYVGQESTDYFNIVAGKNISEEKTEKMLSYQFEFIKFIYNNTKETQKEKKIAIRELMKIVGNINFAKKIQNKNVKYFVIKICNYYLKSIFLNKEKKKILICFLKIFYDKNFKILYKFNLIKFFV
jgi:glycosyltransferase involved in cell wall biosynthesis